MMNDPSSYQEAINKFREERDARMTARPQNWLSLVGLFWLEEGDNSFGSAGSNKVVIDGLPADCRGTINVQASSACLKEITPGFTLNDRAPELRTLHADIDEEPDLLEAGPISMMILKRGDRLLLRVWDADSPAVKMFNGLKYFSVDPGYCLEAAFIPYTPPRVHKILDAIGFEHENALLGQVRFRLYDREWSLEVEDADEEGLISFTDDTRKDCSYPGGRFLTLKKPLGEKVILDFNLAANWPCAYTSFATSPLPPKSNQLPIRMDAGEMRYHK